MCFGKTKQSVCVSTIASPNGQARSDVMFQWIKKWWNDRSKKETKVPEPKLTVPTFLLPASRARYLELLPGNFEAKRCSLNGQLAPLVEEMEALLTADVDPITKELNHRKAAELLKQAKQIQWQMMALIQIVEIETCKQVREEEAQTIVKFGTTLNRSTKPKKEVFREERVIVLFEERIYLVGYHLNPVMKDADDGTKKRVPTGEFEPAELEWITNSLSQLSTEELEMLKAQGVMCNNKP